MCGFNEMSFPIVQGLVLSVAMLICSLIMYSYPWQGVVDHGSVLCHQYYALHCIALQVYTLHSIHKVYTLHSMVKYTIDKKMREYDCAAKTSRRMIVATWCLDGRDIVARETVAILDDCLRIKFAKRLVVL